MVFGLETSSTDGLFVTVQESLIFAADVLLPVLPPSMTFFFFFAFETD